MAVPDQDAPTIFAPPPIAIATAEFHIANDGNGKNPYFMGSSSSWKNRRVARRESNLVRRRFRNSPRTIAGDNEMRTAGGSACTTPTALREKNGGRVAEFERHFGTRHISGLDVPVSSSRIRLRSRGRNTRSHQESSKWLAMAAAPNLPLAARPRVGHIGLDGAVAEWLKAAVC